MKNSKNQFRFKIPSTEDKNTQYAFGSLEAPFYEVHPYFSFRYYHIDHSRYTFNAFESKKEFLRFVEQLHKMSQYKWKAILNEFKSFFHAHKVDWNETIHSDGFKHLPPELREAPVFQFEAFKECRIFGFINHHNIFKIVWVDRYHKICPQE